MHMHTHIIPLRALAGLLLLLLVTACTEDPTGPSSAAAEPVDPGGAANAVMDTRSKLPGIVFGSINMPNSYSE